MDFKDLFSNHAQDYAKYRPGYPPELFMYLSSLCEQHKSAWDCGTGSGQAAVGLAEFFEQVIATDPSEKQLSSAQAHARVEYRTAPAEKSGLENQSVDLITVAQAFHWFKHEEFYSEVRRVLRPRAPLVVWSYAICNITPEVDLLVDQLYSKTLDTYWEPERRSVEKEYRDTSIPFHELTTPRFEMKEQWSLEHLMGYLGTWSALRSYIKKNGTNPLEKIYEPMKRAWGDAPTRAVYWPLSVRVFRILHG
jgi:SAM-dependent methyltransferase